MRRYKTIALYDRLWVQIFKQNSVKAGYFKSHSDALISLHDPNKFSVIGALWDCLKIDGYYEFLMRYPIENEDLHWRQTVNPTHSTIDIRYEKITVNETRAPQFGGLSISKDPQRTLLDGTPTTYPQNWHVHMLSVINLDHGDKKQLHRWHRIVPSVDKSTIVRGVTSAGEIITPSGTPVICAVSDDFGKILTVVRK